MAWLPIYLKKYRIIYCVYQGGPIDYFTHVPVPVAKYSSISWYNEAYTALISLPHFRVLNNEFLNKHADVVP